MADTSWMVMSSPSLKFSKVLFSKQTTYKFFSPPCLLKCIKFSYQFFSIYFSDSFHLGSASTYWQHETPVQLVCMQFFLIEITRQLSHC